MPESECQNQSLPRDFTEIYREEKGKQSPKTLGHGLHGFTRIKNRNALRGDRR